MSLCQVRSIKVGFVHLITEDKKHRFISSHNLYQNAAPEFILQHLFGYLSDQYTFELLYKDVLKRDQEFARTRARTL